MKKHVHDTGGFSLVELLVAAAILGIAIFAIVGIVRKSRDIQVVDQHRQEARALLNTIFEREYGAGKYQTVEEITDDTSTVTIDPHTDGNPLTGVLHTTVIENTGFTTTDGTVVPIKMITLTLEWDGLYEGEKETVTMTKWIAEGQ
ncbi:MAG: type II secretion system protein [Chitinispirillaceae bacterium]|nr:type II secretion system protein [Chitinispirillaceae bacterium]